MKGTPYFRVSGVLQDTERQHAAFKRACAKYNITPSGVTYEDEISASDFGKPKIRPGFERLKAAVAAGKHDSECLWFDEVSRAARAIRKFLPLADPCAERGIKWLVKNRLFDLADQRDMVDLQEMVVDAAKEVTILSERVREAVHVTISHGRPHGRTPFGYLRVYDEHTGVLVGQVEHPEHGPILREIARSYASGVSSHEIARSLNERGITCPHNAQPPARGRNGRKARGHIEGAKWHPSDISSRVSNPVYTGQRCYAGSQEELTGYHDGSWPALLDEETHLVCALRFAESVRARNPDSASHWLTGIARCVNDGDGRDHYVCTRTKRGRQVYVCRAGCLQHDEVEVNDLVLLKMADVMTDAEWKRIIKPTNSVQAEELRRQLAAAEVDLTVFQYDRTVGAKRRLAMVADQEKVIAGIERELHQATMPGPLAELSGPGVANRYNTFLAMTLHKRRAVTRELLTITLKPAGRWARVPLTSCVVMDVSSKDS